MDDVTKAAMEKALLAAIIETNRCLYTWFVKEQKFITRSGSTRLISFDDMNGLFVNWLTKAFKGILGFRTIGGIFRHGKPSISIHETEFYITGIYFPVHAGHQLRPGWEAVAHLKAFIHKMDWESLKYNPVLQTDYSGYMNQTTIAESINSMDLSSISNVKYNIK